MAPKSPLSFWDKYVQPLLDSIMNEPRVTTSMLLVLAIAPFVIIAVVLLMFISQ